MSDDSDDGRPVLLAPNEEVAQIYRETGAFGYRVVVTTEQIAASTEHGDEFVQTEEESYAEFERKLFASVNEDRTQRRRRYTVKLVVSNPEVVSTPTPRDVLSLTTRP